MRQFSSLKIKFSKALMVIIYFQFTGCEFLDPEPPEYIYYKGIVEYEHGPLPVNIQIAIKTMKRYNFKPTENRVDTMMWVSADNPNFDLKLPYFSNTNYVGFNVMINAHYWAPEYYDKDTDELGLLSKKH
jgi:hypothetical protein